MTKRKITFFEQLNSTNPPGTQCLSNSYINLQWLKKKKKNVSWHAEHWTNDVLLWMANLFKNGLISKIHKFEGNKFHWKRFFFPPPKPFHAALREMNMFTNAADSSGKLCSPAECWHVSAFHLSHWLCCWIYLEASFLLFLARLFPWWPFWLSPPQFVWDYSASPTEQEWKIKRTDVDFSS